MRLARMVLVRGKMNLNGIGLRAGWHGGPGPGFRRRRPRAAGKRENSGNGKRFENGIHR